MGYTQHWERTQGATPEEWAAYKQAVRAILAYAEQKGITLKASSTGKEGYVRINGIGEEAHEDFYLTRLPDLPDSRTFCKTNQKPYDIVVCAALAAAEELLPGFSWTSAGEDKAKREGAAFFREAREAAPESVLGKKTKAKKKTKAPEEPEVFPFTLTANVTVDDLAYSLTTSLSDEALFALVKGIDSRMADLAFTEKLNRFFAGEIAKERAAT